LDFVSQWRPEKNSEESLLPERCEDNHFDAHELSKRADRAEQIFESLVAVPTETQEAEKQNPAAKETTGHRHMTKISQQFTDSKATPT
jgi:hypothetical protein